MLIHLSEVITQKLIDHGFMEIAIFILLGIPFLADLMCLVHTDVHGKIKVDLLFVEFLGAIFYFNGDSITYIIKHYGEAFGCDQQCEEVVQISAAVIFLALAFYFTCYLCTSPKTAIRALKKIIIIQIAVIAVIATIAAIAAIAVIIMLLFIIQLLLMVLLCMI